MLKKLAIVCMVMFVFGLTTGSGFAIQYCLDFLEAGNPGGQTTGLKTCDTVNPETVGLGDTFAIDIWAADLPESIISGGFEITFDPTQVSIVSVQAYDNVDITPGPWDGSATFKIDEGTLGPGSYIMGVVQLSCAIPDAGSDVIIGKVTFQCLATGTANITFKGISGFDTTVGCASGTNYDPQMGTGLIAITQQKTCTVNADCDDSVSCTTDVCNQQTLLCENTPDNTACDDGATCTNDVCNAVSGCQNTPDNAACSDGQFCTGVETCDPQNQNADPQSGCVAGTTVTCDDGIACTDDSCDEAGDTCVNDPNDANCPEDGLYCNGIEFCDVNTDCTSPGNPCPAETPVCIEATDECRVPACSITLDPLTSTVQTTDTVQFTVVVNGTCDNEPLYTWGIDSRGCTDDAQKGSTIGSTIGATGLYTAGDTAGADKVTVKDISNGNICATADVTVEVPVSSSSSSSTTTIRPPTSTTSTPASTTTTTVEQTTTTTTIQQSTTTTTSIQPSRIDLRPERWFQSRWFPILLWLNINGTDTSFERRVSVVSFQPANSVLKLITLVLNNENISVLAFIMPQWLTGPIETDGIDVTVTTGSEVVSANLEINLLPFFLEEGNAKAK